ncbi:hypothetical protein ETU08_08225 [Apibacter muscae]|uniref:hypothetical protein n=1 Tax=Apibacter muscae TaxID=2509004 RepID=UPI0011ABC77C|nr:hypothetical protein [Apibacter muscae]TWP28821.1 hypothetical protein ETU08_08225 [Apibacter muscae]
MKKNKSAYICILLIIFNACFIIVLSILNYQAEEYNAHLENQILLKDSLITQIQKNDSIRDAIDSSKNEILNLVFKKGKSEKNISLDEMIKYINGLNDSLDFYRTFYKFSKNDANYSVKKEKNMMIYSYSKKGIPLNIYKYALQKYDIKILESKNKYAISAPKLDLALDFYNCHKIKNDSIKK